MNALSIALVLQVLAFALCFAEIFLPSGGILAAATLGAAIGSIWVAFDDSSLTGWILLGLDLVAFPILVKWGISRISRSSMVLQAHLDESRPAIALPAVGSRGKALADLRPVGQVVIDQTTWDALSSGEFILSGMDVEVVGVAQNHILVRPVRMPSQ